MFSIFLELRVFQEWSRHRYGVYPESGYADDDMYPARYEGDGGEWSNNTGCPSLLPIEIQQQREQKQQQQHMAQNQVGKKRTTFCQKTYREKGKSCDSSMLLDIFASSSCLLLSNGFSILLLLPPLRKDLFSFFCRQKFIQCSKRQHVYEHVAKKPLKSHFWL